MKYAVLVVGWEQTSYTVFEGEDMEICMLVESQDTVLQTQAAVTIFDSGSQGAQSTILLEEYILLLYLACNINCFYRWH